MSAQAYAQGGLAVLEVVGGIHNAEMMREGAKLQRRIDDMNQEFAEYDAWQAERFGDEQANQLEIENKQAVGSMAVANAVNDVDINFGTAQQKKDESVFNGLSNVLDVRAAGYARAKGIRRDALNARLNAGMKQAAIEGAAADAQFAGIVGGVKTAGSAAASKYGYKMGRG